MAYLEVNDLQVEYEKGKPILDNFDFAIEEGELVSLLGPSGCGKSTTLRAVAGFIDPTKGKVTVGDKDVTHLPPNKRDIGLVFQSYALFPHMTVKDNVAFGLKRRGVRGAEMEERVNSALKTVDLQGFGDRRPAQLSGGQRQRVAVARAIVIEPTLLLFDEPLSNLDAKLRIRMRAEIRQIQQRLGITTLYVTHDQVEALAISDRVVVMNDGQIEQDWSPEEIYNKPGTSFVADFMGFENNFSAKVDQISGNDAVVRAGEYVLSVKNDEPLQNISEGDNALVLFRPEAARIDLQPAVNSLPGMILVRTFHGKVLEYLVQTDLGEFIIHQEKAVLQDSDKPVHVVLNPSELLMLPNSEAG